MTGNKWSRGIRCTIGTLIVAVLFAGWIAAPATTAAPLQTANVMAPLHVEDNQWAALESQLDTVRNYGVDAVSVDVWWGLVEGAGDGQFDWSYYDRMFSTIKRHGLQVVPIMSFHQCVSGGSQPFDQPLPAWIWTKYAGRTFNGVSLSGTDLQYKSELGNCSRQSVQLWADGLVADDYARFVRAFKDHFGGDYRNDFIEINVSCGPSGELRYPSYDWPDVETNCPNRGALQCYSTLALRDFREKMLSKYGGLAGVNNAWNLHLTDVNDILPPTDRDNFFTSGAYKNIPYGRDFVDWYNQSLVEHGRTLLTAVIEGLGDAFPSAQIGYKIPGVHWEVADPAMPRAAEVCAGLVQTSVDFNDDATGHGYEKIIGLAKGLPMNRGVVLHFTCLEKNNGEDSANSRAKDLVLWIANEAFRQGVAIKGENAIAGGVATGEGWDRIENAFTQRSYCGLTVLRIGDVAAGYGQARYAAFIQKYRSQFPSLYVRGTNNNWSVTAMRKAGSVWSLNDVVFGSSDAERFKFDVHGDWRRNYGCGPNGFAVLNGGDIAVQPQKKYNITFDEAKYAYAVIASDAAGTSYFRDAADTWYFRGTPNQWGATPMTHVGGGLFKAEVAFSKEDPAPRFKIDHAGDWKESYPSEDYPVGDFGRFEIVFNQADKQIDVRKLAEPTEGLWRQPRLPLGAVYSRDSTTFSLWSPGTAGVQLWLEGRTYPMAPLPAEQGLPGVYTVTVQGDWHLKRYNFRVGGRVARDPYGVMVDAGTDENVVVNMALTAPAGGWAPRPPLKAREDSVIYEVHVRDFSIDPSSGVDPEKRGKFMGMVQGGTTFQGRKTGLDHLKELGVTHVQILPFFDFRSCSGEPASCYNWGYDPLNFNVPEERYSLCPGDPVGRIRELKTMINEFHKAGIRVVMDVVYNHTADAPETTFSPISQQYFVGKNLSGCGNAVDDRNPMVRRFIRDSLEFWTREYHVDGFRFDLMGVFDYTAVAGWTRFLNQQYPDAMLLTYGEPWEGGSGDPVPEVQRARLGTVGRAADAHIGVFNNQYRTALKGDVNSGDNSGYIFNRPQDLFSIRVGSRGAIRYTYDPSRVLPNLSDQMFANAPDETINYVSAHDDLILRDKILLWATNNGYVNQPGYLKRIQEFANGVVVTSQGIPFLHAGDEMLRDKKGHPNTYADDDSINRICWQWKIENADVCEYYRKVIAMRRSHPGFRMTSWNQIDKNITTDDTLHPGVVVNRIHAAANGDDWHDVIVIYNSNDSYDYALPEGTWHVAMEKSDPSAGQDRPVQGKVTAEGTAVTVLHR